MLNLPLSYDADSGLIVDATGKTLFEVVDHNAATTIVERCNGFSANKALRDKLGKTVEQWLEESRRPRFGPDELSAALLRGDLLEARLDKSVELLKGIVSPEGDLLPLEEIEDFLEQFDEPKARTE
jgi:hypothetical protein